MKIRHIQTNFTGGQLDEKALGRTDVLRYNNACAKMINFHPVIQGGAKTVPGSFYVAETKTSSKKSILVPFTFSTSISYVLEFGVGYIRFFRDGAPVLSSGSPYEIATSYTEAELPLLRFAQQSSTLLIACQTKAPAKLVSISNASWSFSDIAFDLPPLSEQGYKPDRGIAVSNYTGTVEITADAATWLASDVGRQVLLYTGVATITSVTSATVAVANVVARMPFLSAALGNWTLTDSPQTSCAPTGTLTLGGTATLTLGAAGWRDSTNGAVDVGRYVFINGGIVKITAYTSTTVVTGLVVKTITSATAQAGAWYTAQEQWSSARGYPQAVALFEGRLLFGGSTSFPSTVWASESGNHLNFTLGVNDNDPWQLNIDAQQRYDEVRHLIAGKKLVAMTYGSEVFFYGKNDGPLTPTGTRQQVQSANGVSAVAAPIRAGQDIVYAQRSGLKVRALPTDKTDQVTNISVLAEDLLESGVVDVAFTQEPFQIFWFPVGNGTMAMLTIDQEQQVFGWGKRTTDGLFESIANIPTSTGDEAWVIVNRTIGGVSKRMVEYFSYNADMDSAKTATGAAATVWPTLLPHLVGKTVDVLANGNVQPQVVVGAGGSVTTADSATTVEAGLPFRGTIELLPVEVDQLNSIMGVKTNISEIVVKVHKTQALTINGNAVPFRRFGALVLDQPITPLTGNIKASEYGWDENQPTVTLTRDVPLPIHILSVAREIKAGA